MFIKTKGVTNRNFMVFFFHFFFPDLFSWVLIDVQLNVSAENFQKFQIQILVFVFVK